MSTSHTIEYSKSSKAKCHGLPPCNGTAIGLGDLRYGQVSFGDYGESVRWRHWGCVTPDILGQLSGIHLDRIPGFKKISPGDQKKIRLAVSTRRIDPADIPDSAKNATTMALTDSSQTKRKMGSDTSFTNSEGYSLNSSQQSSSQPSSSYPSSSRTGPLRPITNQSFSQVIDIDDDEDVEEEVKDELYCMMTTNVVGVQYYKGLVGPGEEVILVREPHNKYDKNAIQVKNIGHVQVGHIPRQIAIKLAPLLDRNVVSVEGVMHEGNLTGFCYSMSMSLKFYGASDKRAQLEPQLVWATPSQRGFLPRGPASSQPVPGVTATNGRPTVEQSRSSALAGPSSTQTSGMKGLTAAQAKQRQAQLLAQQEALRKAAELRTMLNNLEKVDDEGRRSSLLDTLCSTDDVLNLPLHPNPPGIQNGDLVVNLLKHQSQALQWCIEHEYPVIPKKETDKPVQFWQLRKNGHQTYYYNIATKTPQAAAPTLGRGALCGDSMGLGKTLTMLALILATKHDIPPDYSRSSLIVVPLSVLSNWESQIKEHCVRGAISYCIYYGTGRSMTPEELKKRDVVITTYQVVTKEHADATSAKNTMGDGPSQKKRKVEKGLFNVQWKRIILDEGHTIRNPKTKMAKAVCGLSAQRRWVITGTPIINSPRDLGSMLNFLQICRPLDDENFFKRLLLRPLKDGDPCGAELLRALMSQICIRRTKEMQDSEGRHLVPLPPVEMTMIPVQLHEDARALYDAVENVSKQRFEKYMNRHGGVTVPTNVLSMLTRLRQLTLHPGLVPSNYLEELRAGGDDDTSERPAIQITPQERVRLQGLLAQAIEDNEECPICFSVLTDPRITSCAHSFCLACIAEVISRDPKCPMDRRLIGMADLLEPLSPTELTQIPLSRDEEERGDDLRSGSSAKIDQLVYLLKLTPGNEKSLVFSQFTSFLDKIAETLSEEGIPFTRFDGKMSAKRRQETLEQFSIPLDEDTKAPEATPLPSTRTRRGASKATKYGAAIGDDDIDDGDFIADRDDDDDCFLDDDDDDSVWTKQKSKGKGKRKSKISSSKNPDFDSCDFSGQNPKVMLISLKAGALGLNLTVANNVYLMDPWWQEGIESQAIDRCNRIGQKKPVHVYQLIAENTVESKVIDIQEKKKNLIKQAFAGIKSTETQRQKKEARLQDLIALFGVRQQAASQSTIG